MAVQEGTVVPAAAEIAGGGVVNTADDVIERPDAVRIGLDQPGIADCRLRIADSEMPAGGGWRRPNVQNEPNFARGGHGVPGRGASGKSQESRRKEHVPSPLSSSVKILKKRLTASLQAGAIVQNEANLGVRPASMDRAVAPECRAQLPRQGVVGRWWRTMRSLWGERPRSPCPANGRHHRMAGAPPRGGLVENLLHGDRIRGRLKGHDAGSKELVCSCT
jgi:hypothetical protein